MGVAQADDQRACTLLQDAACFLLDLLCGDRHDDIAVVVHRLLQADDQARRQEGEQRIVGAFAIQRVLSAFGHDQPELGPGELDRRIGGDSRGKAHHAGVGEQRLDRHIDGTGAALNAIPETQGQVVRRGIDLHADFGVKSGDVAVGECATGIDVDRIHVDALPARIALARRFAASVRQPACLYR